MLSTTEAERMAQLAEGARMARSEGESFGSFTRRPGTLSVRRNVDRAERPARSGFQPRSKPANAAKGHEAFLKALETSGASISVLMASDGESIVGRVKTSDKFTVSLETNDGTWVVFKHDISRFKPLTPRPNKDTETTAAGADEGNA
ncbi:RNA chaperone Hfq [Ralstonia pickettii]|uniref:RNA chaperone Hfq n=1 Tax=Ralstonia pickettii TaxID=329 RepID=UPI002714ADAD|nr:RNA chaperone Hfq [Ralstonia pickettii]WKZ86373.1 RNA chaperone Hfq [Ralstonia pickettii]